LDLYVYFRPGLRWKCFWNSYPPCSGLPGELNADPIYLDPVNDEYALQPGSPGIDSGFDLRDDRNVGGPGLFNGAGPDRGLIEAD
jgi:hypothetical protein